MSNPYEFKLSIPEATRRVEEHWRNLHCTNWGEFEIGNGNSRKDAMDWALSFLQALGLVAGTSQDRDAFIGDGYEWTADGLKLITELRDQGPTSNASSNGQSKPDPSTSQSPSWVCSSPTFPWSPPTRTSSTRLDTESNELQSSSMDLPAEPSSSSDETE